MDPKRNDPSRSFNFPSSFPKLWENIEDKMNQWMGKKSDSSTTETGISISEDNQYVYVEAQLPGIRPEELDISLHQNQLWIKAEKKEVEDNKDKKFYRRARSSFNYQVELPALVEDNTEQTDYQNGILKMTFKKAPQSQKRKISINKPSI